MNILEQMKLMDETTKASRDDRSAIEIHFADIAKEMAKNVPYYDQMSVIHQANVIHCIWITLASSNGYYNKRAESTLNEIIIRYASKK